MITAKTLRYYYMAAKYKGVPTDSLDDAVQDMWIKLRTIEEGERGWKAAVAFAAIDAARKYGWTSQYGRDRGTDPLEYAYNLRDARDEMAIADRMMDTAAALKRLPPAHVALINRRVWEGRQSYGAPWSNVEHIRLCNARKRLRKMIA